MMLIFLIIALWLLAILLAWLSAAKIMQEIAAMLTITMALRRRISLYQ